MKLFLLVLMLLPVALRAAETPALSSSAPALSFSAFARASAPGARNGVIFGELKNATEAPLELRSASCDASSTVELHQHLMNADGTMHMQAMPSISIPATGSTVLKPGGQHLMLIGLSRSLVQGENVSLTLTLADGQQLTLVVPILDAAAMELPSK